MSQSKQPILRFSHPSGVLNSSQWRHGLKTSTHLEGVDLDQFSVCQSSTAFSITARTPTAAPILDDRVMDFMRATASVVGKTLDVQKLDLSPNITDTGYRWTYRIPKWVVARPSKSKTKNAQDAWKAWRCADIGEDLKTAMLDKVTVDLTTQLIAWTGACPDLDLRIEDYGRPMVLKDAIVNRPKAVSVMARLDVVLSSSHRIEAALYAGLFNVLGFGRVFRRGYQENKEAGQE